MCQCDAGYQPNTTNDGCSLTPIKSNAQVCQDAFGISVDWDGTKATNGDLNCNCKTGYVWNSGRTACVLPPPIPTPDPVVPTAPKISTPTTPQTETKIITPASPAKKEVKVPDIIKVDQKEASTTQSGVETEKKLPWYQRIFSWFFK
jgi:hypothetical protein